MMFFKARDWLCNHRRKLKESFAYIGPRSKLRQIELQPTQEKKTIGYFDGSYTVEASLVMPFLLLIFVTLLYMIFYLHDLYMLEVYTNRMAAECCWLYVENESALEERDTESLIEEVADQYEEELQKQLLMTELTSSEGSCKKNLLTGLYTATWSITGEVSTAIDVSLFHVFDSLSSESTYSRVYARDWIYEQEILTGGDS